MKRILLSLFVLVICMSSASAYTKKYHGTLEVEVSEDPVPGVWNSQYDKVLEKARETGAPVVIVSAMSGCSRCSALCANLSKQSVKDWLAERKYLCLFGWYSESDGKRVDRLISSWNPMPQCSVYWDQDGDGESDFNPKDYTWIGSDAKSEVTFMKNCDKYVGTYVPHPGGDFDYAETEGSRYETEDGVKEVVFTLKRTEGNAKYAATNNYVVLDRDGTNVLEKGVFHWAVGDMETNLTVDVATYCKGFENGDQLTVKLLESKKFRTITYIAGNSAGNPLWIGERVAPAAKKMLTAASTPELDYGEWTMDLDVAKTMVENKGGYTLVSVQGSLWCPDCANTERNFLDLTNSAGENAFCKWAKEKQIALVSIDIPNFTSSNGAYASPTLLSRTAYASTLARNTYTNKYGVKTEPTKSSLNKTVFPKETPELTGAPEGWTKSIKRSGLGYLMRKNVSDKEAEAVLKRNHELVLKNTSEGGFHRPEDGNAYRTGVPIFVLLRQDGTVAGRFTTFASQSPFLKDRANIEAYEKRIEELIREDGQIDNGEIENNDARTTQLKLTSSGAATGAGDKTAKCISHADAIDVYELKGVSEGVLQSIALTRPLSEKGDGKVTLELQKLGADGRPTTVMHRPANSRKDVPVSGTALLSKGVFLEYEFKDSGRYFVAVKADTSDAGFAVAKKDSTWMAYTLQTAMLIEPGEKSVSTPIDDSYETVSLRVKRGEWYYIEGLKDGVEGKLDGPYKDGTNTCYMALITGDVVAEIAEGATAITHQLWRPGEVGFGTTSNGKTFRQEIAKTVKENVDTVKIPISRVNGGSAVAMVRIWLDAKASENIYREDDGVARFDDTDPAFTNMVYTWGDGKSGQTNHVFKIVDDERFDGPCKFVFRMELEDGFATLLNDTYTLTVNENDTKSAGKATFVGVRGSYFAKSGTVYARASDPVELDVTRVAGSDAVVTGVLKTTYGTIDPKQLEWGFHNVDTQTVTVTGIDVGKTATVSFSKYYGGLKGGSPASVKIVSIADDAPAFVHSDYLDGAYRYVAFSNLYVVTDSDDSVLTNALSFTKLSGSLPSGLTAAWDKAAHALCIKGVPTKAGTYTVYYQVTETIGRTRVPGMPAEITIEVVDPAVAPVPGMMPINASCAKARTFTDLIMVNEDYGRLTGTLTLTIPANTGKISAKYICEAGTVSFTTAKNWSELEEGSGALIAELRGSGKNSAYTLVVRALNTGANQLSAGEIEVELFDPAVGKVLTRKHDGIIWSKTVPAKSWEGYYTVALTNHAEAVSEETKGFATLGTGYLTLKMEGASAYNAGKVTWALFLPNGTTASGSATLSQFFEATQSAYAYLPIFKKTSTDLFAGVIKIANNAKETHKGSRHSVDDAAEEGVSVLWRHNEAASAAAAKAGYEVAFGAIGGIYDKTENFYDCCDTYYLTTKLGFFVGMDDFVGGAYKFDTVYNPVAMVKAESTRISIDTREPNPNRVSLSLNRTTGVVTGSFRLGCTEKATDQSKEMSVNYRGVVLLGWGPGCCSTSPVTDVFMPLVNGSWYFTDKVTYRKPGATRDTTLSTKRGCSMSVDLFGDLE